MSKIWRARLETRNFLFEAFGRSEAEASSNLYKGLRRHQGQYGLDVVWVDQMEEEATVERLDFACYRDREIISPASR